MRRNRNITSVLVCFGALVFVLAAVVVVDGVRPTYAQGNAAIYASADLLPDGVSPEGGGGTGPKGTATFARMDNGMTRVTVTFTGLAPNSAHANHIHDGSCTGKILYPLQTLHADASGMARAVTDLSASVEFERWYISAHQGETLPSAGIACGKVTPALAGAPPPVPQPGPPSTVGGGQVPGMPRTGLTAQSSSLSVLFVATVGLFIVMGICLRVADKRPT